MTSNPNPPIGEKFGRVIAGVVLVAIAALIVAAVVAGIITMFKAVAS